MVGLRGIDMLGVEALAARLEAVADPARLRLAGITRRCGDGAVWECELGGVVAVSKTLGPVRACYQVRVEPGSGRRRVRPAPGGCRAARGVDRWMC